MIGEISRASVSELVRHPSIYEWVRDDGTAPRAFYEAPEGLTYLGTPDFFAAFVPVSKSVWEVHIGAHPRIWGRSSDLLAECFEEMAARGALKILGHCPAYNERALRCCLKAGMEIEGVRTASFLKDGLLHDQICLGISFPPPPTRVH